MMEQKKQPNIVYILNDHQAFYGHAAKRPVFDQFAAEGMRFSNAYTVCPLCGPARRSMLTSLYPHNHKEYGNDTDHPFDRALYLDVLAENGYEQYYFGKWHAGTGTALEHGCKGFSYPSYNNPYTKPEYKEYLKENGLPEPEIFIEQDFIFWDDTERRGTIIKQDQDWCNEHCAGIMLTPKETHEAFFLANMAKKQLQELATQKDKKPFHLRVDFWGPHQPFFPTHEFVEMYRPSEIDLPVSFRENVYQNNKPEVYTDENNRGLNKDGKLIYPNPIPEETWKLVLARAYAQATLVDAAAGVILEALREYGLEEDTLVVMATDHGDGLACHGGHFDKASYMPEEMLRVPMALRYPGVVAPGQVRTELVSNMDVGATFLDAAGLSYPEPVDGLPLLRINRSGESWRDVLVSETHGHWQWHIGRALRAGKYKLIFNQGQINELYDLESDPYELNNLAGKEPYQEQYNQMLQKLRNWAVETGDSALLKLL